MADPKALRQFLDVVSDAVVVVDRGAGVHFANAAAVRLLACAPGTPLRTLAPRLGDALVDAVVATVSRGIPRLDAPRPAVPARVTVPGGGPFDVAFVPFEGERWALRLAAVRPPGEVADAAASRAGASAQAHATAQAPAPTEGRPGEAPAGAPRHASDQGTDRAGELLRLFWDSPLPMFVQDMDFTTTHVNPACAAFTGYPADQLVGRDPVVLQPEEDRPASLDARDAVRARGGREALIERRLVDAAGRLRWVRIVRRVLVDADGREHLVSVLFDSTAEHLARDSADRSAREIDDGFDLTPVAMVLYDEQGLVLRANPAFEQLAGQAPVALDDAPPAVQQLLAWQDGAPSALLRPGAPPLASVAWLPRADGSLVRLRALVRCVDDGTGRLRHLAVVEDRSAEEERDLAQVQLDALMDTAGVGLATYDEAGGWVQHGSAFAGARDGGTAAGAGSGTAPHAALQSIRRDVVLPDSLPEYERLQHALRHGEPVEVRYAIRHPELGPRWLLTRVAPARLASGKRTLSVVTLDVTDQQQSQQRSEVLLREMTTLLETATVGIACLRGHRLVRCNRRFEALLGFGAGEAFGMGLQPLFAAHPQAAAQLAPLARTLDDGGTFEAEFPLAPGDRPATWCALTARRVGGDDAEPEVIVVLTDVTRLKQQQHELEALARDRGLMFSASDVGIAFVRGGRIQGANEALSRLSGFAPSELALSPLSELFVNATEYRRLRQLSEQGLQQLGRWSGEHPLRRRDGTLVWVQVSQRLVHDGDPSGGFIASFVNVDDRHRAQQAVALQAERTRAILDSVLVGIVTVGPGGIEWMNRSARRMFGGDLADFVDRPISAVATADPEHPFRRTRYLNDLVEGQAETFECRVQARDGRAFWVVGNAVATGRDATGRQLTYALLDIERRRQAEARTAQAQSSLQRILESAPLAITLFDARTLRVLEVNAVAAGIVERVPRELVGLALEDFMPPGEAAARRADMTQALDALTVMQREHRIVTHGEARVWDARYLPLAAPGERPDQLLIVATDVTEQRAAQEARYEAAIAQREMLVKEVHHRIKNNLQGVAGLLQQIGARKPEMADAMAEVGGQVQAIAQVYGLQVGVSGPLRLRSVLEAITGSVQRTFGRALDLVVEGAAPERWVLPEAESIPIALTLNELLTNAIKHSAGVDPSSVVAVRLVSGEGGVQVVIANPGRLPAGFSLARYPGGVSGLGLIRALLPRRSASLAMVQEGDRVVATVALVPPGVTRVDPA